MMNVYSILHPATPTELSLYTGQSMDTADRFFIYMKRKLLSILEVMHLYSAPYIISARCLPGNVLLPEDTGAQL